MMSELRWALLILGVVFIVTLAWWERRRPRQASGALSRAPARESAGDAPQRLVREPPLTLPEVRVREPVVAQELPAVAATRAELAVPKLEPPAQDLLSATDELRALDEMSAADESRTAGEAGRANGLPMADEMPMADEQDALQTLAAMSSDDAADAAADVPPPVSATLGAAAPGATPLHEVLPERPSGASLVVDWPAEHERHVLALRLVAPLRERFAGRSLRQALAAEGFLLGQFAIFHKPDEERRAMLSAASLTRPGTFDMETMDSQHYGGLSLFAVLPGPKSPAQAFDELVFAARNLNERLHGVLQDEQGTPLTPARIAQLRERLRPGAGS